MKQITCPHCGDTYPDFDVAHVCSKGPYVPRLKPIMNERIKELAEQAQQYAEYITPQGLEWLPAFKEKFAELIVWECISMIENEAAQYAEPVWATELVNDIEERFGVNK